MTRYLASKRSVDDRALNRGVLDAFRQALAVRAGRKLRVLELGAGLGSMVERLAALGLPSNTHYTLLESDARCLREAERRLHAARADLAGLELAFERADLFEYMATGCEPGAYDVVIANAVLDLVNVPAVLPLLWRTLVPEGLAWLTINFDGETILLPELPLDRQITHLYHRSMDVRVSAGRASGDSKTGRKLLHWLPESGATLLCAGSSDWVVWPSHGRYPDDEAYFLHHIVDTVDTQLRALAELDSTAFGAWVQARHAQIESGTLAFIAHQLDVLALAPGT